jgi:hypothetical protein
LQALQVATSALLSLAFSLGIVVQEVRFLMSDCEAD